MNPKAVLREAGLHAVKSLGQHFLSSESKVELIVEAVKWPQNSTIIEIGPGLGALTDKLAELSNKVIAIEKDPKLIPFLKERYNKFGKGVEIRNQDFLDYAFEDIKEGEKCVVFGNLPYYISSPILFHLVDFRKKISSAVLTLQREVAERLSAKPHSKVYGRLTLSFGLFADVKRVFDIRRNEFYPQPQVGSSTVLVQFKDGTKLPAGVGENLYSKVVKLAFGTRRKQISNALSSKNNGGWPRAKIESALSCAGIDSKARAENLSMDSFLNLCAALVELELR